MKKERYLFLEEEFQFRNREDRSNYELVNIAINMPSAKMKNYIKEELCKALSKLTLNMT